MNRASKHDKLMKAFGRAVRYYRNRADLSQEALADRAGLDRSYMSQIERGIKNATLGSIWRICTALGIDPSALLVVTEMAESGGALDPNVELPPKTQLDQRKADGEGAVLVVDDDGDICETIAAVLGDTGYKVETAFSGLEAMRHLATRHIVAVVSDIRMNNGNGLELLETMRNHYPAIPVIFMTGYDDVTAEDARRRGAVDLFSKPFDISLFIERLRQSIDAAKRSVS